MKPGNHSGQQTGRSTPLSKISQSHNSQSPTDPKTSTLNRSGSRSPKGITTLPSPMPQPSPSLSSSTNAAQSAKIRSSGNSAFITAEETRPSPPIVKHTTPISISGSGSGSGSGSSSSSSAQTGKPSTQLSATPMVMTRPSLSSAAPEPYCNPAPEPYCNPAPEPYCNPAPSSSLSSAASATTPSLFSSQLPPFSSTPTPTPTPKPSPMAEYSQAARSEGAKNNSLTQASHPSQPPQSPSTIHHAAHQPSSIPSTESSILPSFNQMLPKPPTTPKALPQNSSIHVSSFSVHAPLHITKGLPKDINPQIQTLAHQSLANRQCLRSPQHLPANLLCARPDTMPTHSTQLLPREIHEMALNVVHTVFDSIGSYCAPQPPQYEGPPPFSLYPAQIVSLFQAVVTYDYGISLQSLVSVRCPAKIYGDLHGQFHDLLNFFRFYGKPCPYTGDLDAYRYIFNGDFVDRGPNSLEVLILLVCLRLVYKDRIILIRGNHEAETTSYTYGFHTECRTRFGASDGEFLFNEANKLFNYLPLGALVESLVPDSQGLFRFIPRILVIHGGIGPNFTSIEQLRNVTIPCSADDEVPIIEQVLWDDPADDPTVEDFVVNKARGSTAFLFSEQAVARFCASNRLDMVIRSHQCIHDGFELLGQGRMLTVFSAPNYCNVKGNHAAFVIVTDNPDTGSIHITPCVLDHIPGITNTAGKVFAAGSHSAYPPNTASAMTDPSRQPYSSLSPVMAQPTPLVHGSVPSLHNPSQQSFPSTSPTPQYNASSYPASNLTPSTTPQLPSLFPASMQPAPQTAPPVQRPSQNNAQPPQQQTNQGSLSYRQKYLVLDLLPRFKADSGLQDSVIQSISSYFTSFADVSSSGGQPFMSHQSFHRFLVHSNALPEVQEKSARLFHAIDFDGDGSVSLDEFAVGFIAMHPQTRHNFNTASGYVRMLLIFRVYDNDEDGLLYQPGLVRMLSDACMDAKNANVTEPQIRQMASSIVPPLGKGINFESFLDVCEKQNLTVLENLFRFRS